MLVKVPNFSGLSPWILADFRSPRRVLPKVQDGYNRKGLISSQGVRKKAFFTLQQFYRQIQMQTQTQIQPQTQTQTQTQAQTDRLPAPKPIPGATP